MSKEQFHELSDYIVEYFNDLQEKLNLPVDLKYVYQADDKQKTLVKIVKIADRYSTLLGADLLVSFNEDYFDAFDDESKNILIDQELALLHFDLEKGQLKISKPDLITSSGIVKKYGVEAVGRANQVRDLYNQQQEDKEKENRENKPKNNRFNKK
jgi:hypothetical protein